MKPFKTYQFDIDHEKLKKEYGWDKDDGIELRPYLKAFLGIPEDEKCAKVYGRNYRPMYIWNIKPQKQLPIVFRLGTECTSIVPVDNSKTKMMPFEGCT